jgi:predicted DNA-binding transcriptional regulator AlpA
MPVQTSPDPLLTERQAAEILGVKPASLQVWRTTKRYPLSYVKVGRLVRYRLSALHAFLTAREVTN